MKNTGVLLFFIFVFVSSKAQETNPASGGNAIGPGGSISYTVGQLVYTNLTTAAGSLHQGIQESIEFVTLSNPELTAVTLKAVTYPNPTTEFIILALNDGNLTGVSYAMYDLLGRFVSKGAVTQAETKIAMNSLPIGVYILRVQQNNKVISCTTLFFTFSYFSSNGA
jgi:hypothetical protein